MVRCDHYIKGSAGGVGYPMLTQLAIEFAIAKQDEQEVLYLLQVMATQIGVYNWAIRYNFPEPLVSILQPRLWRQITTQHLFVFIFKEEF